MMFSRSCSGTMPQICVRDGPWMEFSRLKVAKGAGGKQRWRARTRVRCSSGEEETGVVIVGAGLAGLAAARQLAQARVPFLLLEASDGVGGRVRTDKVQGYLLDRGFQLLFTGYPEAQQVLDFQALQLHKFYAGALVWLNGSFHRVADPLRHPVDGILSLANPVGSVVDKSKVGLARLQAVLRSVDDILAADEVSIDQKLHDSGFSKPMIEAFFRPFFGGVFFDPQLQTSSRLYEFVFRSLATGSNTLPAHGMGAISQQLADQLPPASLRLNTKVATVLVGPTAGSTPSVKLQDGGVIMSKYGVVVAAEGPEARRLLGEMMAADPSVTRPPRPSITIYFSADEAPHPEPVLFLNGSGQGLVNSLVVVSNVAPSYAPPGKCLISAAIVDCSLDRDHLQLEQAVRAQLSEWFGASVVAGWQHLRTYHIPYGQPDQSLPTNLAKDPRLGRNLYVCGDHRDHATQHGALVSGRRAAQALLADSMLSL